MNKLEVNFLLKMIYPHFSYSRLPHTQASLFVLRIQESLLKPQQQDSYIPMLERVDAGLAVRELSVCVTAYCAARTALCDV